MRTGKPRASTQTWILVPKPPRDRPSAWASSPPFSPRAGGLGVGADHGGVQHDPFQVGLGRDRLEQPGQHPHLDPAVVAPLGCLVGSKPLRQITPPTARARHPQQRIHKQPAIAARSTLALAAARHERLDPRPLIVSKNLAFQHRLQKAALNQNRAPLRILNRHHDLERLRRARQGHRHPLRSALSARGSHAWKLALWTPGARKAAR